MAIRIGNEVLESAEGSATFNGTSLTRIIYDNTVVWDKGVDVTMTNGLNLIPVECGVCDDPQCGYAIVRVANAIDGQDVCPSVVCFHNVVNPYSFDVAIQGGICGHVKIGNNWYTFSEQYYCHNQELSISDTTIVPINCDCFKVEIYKEQTETYDSDEFGFEWAWLNVCNATTGRAHTLDWQQGQTYCV